MIKACVFNLGENIDKLLITAHHLVVDGVSWRIILEDISIMIKQINNGQRIRIASKTHSYQDWANVLGIYCKNGIDEEKNYWRQVLSKEFFFPIDYDLGKDTIESTETIVVQIRKDLTKCLLTKANIPYNTEPKDLLITSLLRTIKNLFGSEDIIIELEGHGRDDLFERVDLSRTVGWFTSLYPFYIKLTKNDLSSQIKEVKKEIRRIPNNGVGFGILKYISNAFNDRIKKYVRFNFLGDFTTGHANNPVRLLNEQLGYDCDRGNNLTYILEINCFIICSRLNVLFTYSKNKFSKSTVELFGNNYINNLKSIIKHCCGKESVEYTPSDFDAIDISQKELDSLFTD